MCLVFRETLMYGQITDKAIAFQTMISPIDAGKPQDGEGPGDKLTRSVPSHMFSSRSLAKSSSPSKPASGRPKTLLAYNDFVPIYDARRIVVDFAGDLDRLGQVLPLFPGEVPPGSFTVVGYTCSSYSATLSGASERVPHLGCNILWVIV
ncbi:hypothetical protein B0H10DRAFT_1913496 [Mycena sp. CBHHK59/15]|nr:hypothetical protein B0H10DRAFT_1913496 [Mycena sp. CBHHK59/15]